MDNDPAIVVVAYNRPDALKRLLDSLKSAVYPHTDITLVISVDKSESEKVAETAGLFNWTHGNKKVIQHSQHLGLKEHVLKCGELTREYDSVIILEDDLMVSPHFYTYAVAAKNFYNTEPRVAGISLYTYEVTESCFYPFRAIDDGSDAYFMQVASSWGQLWTRSQWLAFTGWLTKHPELPETPGLPEYLYRWGAHSWKKHFIHYLVDTETYFVFPRLSLSTNFEEAGTNSQTKGVFQVPLQVAERNYLFMHFSDSEALYDAWFELTPATLNKYNPALRVFDYEVDLYGTKNTSHLKKNYLLTSKHNAGQILGFSHELFPLENNVLFNLRGKAISLCAKNTSYGAAQTGLQSRLKVKGEDKLRGISLILLLNEEQLPGLDLSFKSFSEQPLPAKELIIISSDNLKERVEKAVINSKLVVKTLYTDLKDKMPRLQLGFREAHYEIVAWMEGGTIMAADAFEKVMQLLSLNQSLNWVCGIDEKRSSQEEYSKVRALPYRLTQGELYRRLQAKSPLPSTELHFFRKAIVEGFRAEVDGTDSLLFHLISCYQLSPVIFCFGKRRRVLDAQAVGDAQRSHLLHRYRHFKVNIKWNSRLMNLLLKTPLFNDGSWQWYLTALHNYPDVWRYDEENDSFYPSKY